MEEKPAQVAQEQHRSNMIHYQAKRYGLQDDVLLIDPDDHVTYEEAIIGPEFEKWLEVVKSKMEYMYTNQV